MYLYKTTISRPEDIADFATVGAAAVPVFKYEIRTGTPVVYLEYSNFKAMISDWSQASYTDGVVKDIFYDKGYALDGDYALYDVVSEKTKHNTPIADIDFKVQLMTSLYWQETFVFGRLLRKTGFLWADEENRVPSSTKVVVCNFDYAMNNINMADGRDEIIKWYLRDGTLGPAIKTMPKKYNTVRQGDESKIRRENIMDQLKSETMLRLIYQAGYSFPQAYTEGEAFMALIQADIDAFIYRANNGILSVVQNSTATLLDVQLTGETVRQMLLSRLDYWTYEAGGGQYKGTLLP